MITLLDEAGADALGAWQPLQPGGKAVRPELRRLTLYVEGTFDGAELSVELLGRSGGDAVALQETLSAPGVLGLDINALAIRCRLTGGGGSTAVTASLVGAGPATLALE